MRRPRSARPRWGEGAPGCAPRCCARGSGWRAPQRDRPLHARGSWTARRALPRPAPPAAGGGSGQGGGGERGRGTQAAAVGCVLAALMCFEPRPLEAAASQHACRGQLGVFSGCLRQRGSNSTKLRRPLAPPAERDPLHQGLIVQRANLQASRRELSWPLACSILLPGLR